MTYREQLRAEYEALLGGEGERLGRLLLEALRWHTDEVPFEKKGWLEQKAWMDEGLRLGEEEILTLGKPQ